MPSTRAKPICRQKRFDTRITDRINVPHVYDKQSIRPAPPATSLLITVGVSWLLLFVKTS